MSNKTIYKRIALVAVSALSAGLLSVTPASATNNNATGGENVAPVADELNIAVATSIQVLRLLVQFQKMAQQRATILLAY